MKEILNNLWENYFLEECSVINTKEEKELMKKLGDLREKAKTAKHRRHPGFAVLGGKSEMR